MQSSNLDTKNKLDVFKGLFVPIDISILVFFRISFGAIMLWEVLRYFSSDWIARYWIEPTFHFKYYGFDWVHPLPGDFMYLHFIALGILSIFIITGFKYRISTTLFFLAFTYMFLLEQSRYLNHFYLIAWISFLMIFVPAHRAFSIDALRNKKLQSDTVLAWPLWLLRAQIGIVYFFGGIAKLNPDWLGGEPMRMWLAQRIDFPLLGPVFTDEWVVFSFVYGALLIDLCVVPFLLWKKTRLVAFGILIIFHLVNNELFSIGIFPWFMIFAALLFFSPDWPRRLVNFVRRIPEEKKYRPFKRANNEKMKKIIIILFLSFLTVQVLIPIRHYFYPGDVNWTEEGHNFAWHMKLRDKDSWGIVFYATDPTTEKTWRIDPNDDLNKAQINVMSKRPDMILQYAHHVADLLREEGYDQIEIRTNAVVSLNGREPQRLIDPNVNLAEQPISILPKSWIIQLRD